MTAERTVLLIHGMASSRRTWWRTARDLEARGWAVDSVDLPGHGDRPIGATRTLADLAEDVVAQRPAGSTLLVGHSVGAIVALQLARVRPAYARGVLLEDPPSLGGTRAAPGRTAPERTDDLEREAQRVRSDPGGVVDSLLLGHPTWSRRDARSVLDGRLRTDPRVEKLSPGDITMDLPTLVSACAVPVALVAAGGRYSALLEPERGALLRLLPAERVTEVVGSHHVHFDDPARWVDAVDRFGVSLL